METATNLVALTQEAAAQGNGPFVLCPPLEGAFIAFINILYKSPDTTKTFKLVVPLECISQLPAAHRAPAALIYYSC